MIIFVLQAFTAYLKFIYMAKHKDVFDVHKLNFEKFARLVYNQKTSDSIYLINLYLLLNVHCYNAYVNMSLNFQPLYLTPPSIPSQRRLFT